MMMRDLIQIVERRAPRGQSVFEASTLLKVTAPFIRRVRQIADHIAADIADDFAQDDAGFRRQIQAVITRINESEPLGPVMTLVRAELRPSDVDPAGITSVGCHWSYTEGGARVYHHDNAKDEYGHDTVNVIFLAKASFQAIDWPYTIATNLIHPAEEEITVKNGAKVSLQEIFVGRDWHDAKGRVVLASGHYDDY